MDKKYYKISELKEHILYHQVGEFTSSSIPITDKTTGYFVEDGKLYFIRYSSDEIKECNEPYNIVIKTRFVEANSFIDFKKIEPWAKVEALVNGKWCRRYLLEVKDCINDIYSDEGTVFNWRKKEILVTPVSKDIIGDEELSPIYIEQAEAIRITKGPKAFKYLSWKI